MPVFAGAALLLAMTFVFHSAVILRMAQTRAVAFADLVDFDGFGVYAMTANDWRQIADRHQIFLRRSLLWACFFAVVLWDTRSLF